MSLNERVGYLKDFSELEASFRIEGLDPSGDALYEKAKAAVLNGKMTLDEAIDFAIEGSAPRLLTLAVGGR